MELCQCGLIFKKKLNEYRSEECQVPLKSISVDLSITGFVADVTSTLTYKNEEKDAVEAAFIFPMDEQGAVYHFQAEIDGRVIIGECQTKEEAQETYNEAVEAGATAFLMNQEKTSDVFRIIIGNLPSQTDAVIKFSYVIELPMDVDNSIKFVLPSVLNPRYGDPGTSISKDQPESSQHTITTKSPYQFSLQGAVSAAIGSKVTKVKSDSHIIDVTLEGEDTKAKVKLGEPNFEKDITLNISYSDIHKPQAIYEAGSTNATGFMKSDVVMMNFFPEIGDNSTNCGEYIFVVDRSGSMRDTKISNAKETLLLFLKSLPVGCFFNVVSFGSSFDFLFKGGSAIYNESNLKIACNLQKEMEANMGGTEIYAPLENIYQSPCKKDHPRQIFLLTDGEVWDTDKVIDIVKKNAQNTRVFTFGIGAGASTALVKGVARAGRGMCELVQGSEKLQSKVMGILKQARQDFTSDVQLKWTLPGTNSVVAIPKEIPPIFSGQNLIMYGLVNEQILTGAIAKVELSWKVGAKEHKCVLEIDPALSNDGTSLHRLAAKKKILELQLMENQDEANKAKEAIVLMSTSANIVSNHTSFIAVDKDSKDRVEFAKPGSGIKKKKKKVKGMRAPEDMMKAEVLVRCAAMAMPIMSSQSMQFTRSAKKYKKSSGVFSKIGESFHRAVSWAQPAQTRKKSAPMARSCERSMMAMGVSTDEERTDQKNSLMQMIDEQAFDGHWEPNKVVAALLGMDVKTLKTSSPIKWLTVWATALVLAWLDTEYSGRKDEWEMIGEKAHSWLNSRGQEHEGKNSAKLIEEAKKVLNK